MYQHPDQAVGKRLWTRRELDESGSGKKSCFASWRASAEIYHVWELRKMRHKFYIAYATVALALTLTLMVVYIVWHFTAKYW